MIHPFPQMLFVGSAVTVVVNVILAILMETTVVSGRNATVWWAHVEMVIPANDI